MRREAVRYAIQVCPRKATDIEGERYLLVVYGSQIRFGMVMSWRSCRV